MITYNQALAILAEIAEAHLMIQQFGKGSLADIPEGMNYPYMWAQYEPASVNLSTRSDKISFNILFADLLHEDKSNEVEILSDQKQIALDVVAQLQLPAYRDKFEVEDGVTLEPIIENYTTDSIAGWLMNITLRVDYLSDACQAPSTLNPGDDVGCPGVQVYDTAGVLLASVVAGATYTVTDTTVKNSAGTTLATGRAQSIITLADITFTDYEGTQSSKPAGTNVAATQLSRTYAFPQPTGQTTIFRTGDDAWVQQNIFNALARGYIVPLASFSVLRENNVFGNTNRFTDHLGGQSYAASYMIDNYTGLGWYLVVPGQTSWSNQIDAALALSLTIGASTYDDWFMPNLHQVTSLYNKGMPHSLNYAPFNISIATGFRTSTTVPNATSNSYGILTNPFGSSQFSKSGNDPILYCRKHF